MTLITVQDGKIVLRDGKVGTGEACCCGICPCSWPRLLSVTVAGFPDGYYWASRNGGQPPEGGGFEPACGEGANAGDPAVRFGGVAVGQAGYQYSARYRDLNATFTAEYVEGSGCTCPQWYGDIEVVAVSGDDNLPAEECPTPQLAGMTITLCQQESYVNLIISAPGTEGGQQATATVTGISSGAISATQITSAGSGYAYLETERVEPTVTASIGSATGSGAELSVTLSETTDFNGDAVWEVTGVTVISPGSGYSEYDWVDFIVTDGEVGFFGASAFLTLNRLQPTLGVTASTSGGSGATFSVSLTATTDFNGNDVWQVDSVSVTNGGSGYQAADTLSIDSDGAVEVWPASLALELQRSEPVVEASVVAFGEGAGAVLSVTLNQTTDFDGKTAWEVSAISVTNAGEGYGPSDYVSFSVTSGNQIMSAGASITLGEDGEVISVTVLAGGLFYDTTDVIAAVTVSDGGEYYATDGAIDAVTVTDGGNYYKEQYTGNVIVNTPSVTIVSNTGRDAVITATVEDDPLSANFGKVVALTIDNGGQKYAIEGPSWFLTFEGFGLYPLDGRRPGFTEGTVFLPAVEPICQGEDQSGEAGFFSDRVELTGCGESLLSRTYSAYYYAEIFPGGVAADKMPAGAAYSLGSPPFRAACTGLAVVDWGGGPMTVAISPA